MCPCRHRHLHCVVHIKTNIILASSGQHRAWSWLLVEEEYTSLRANPELPIWDIMINDPLVDTVDRSICPGTPVLVWWIGGPMAELHFQWFCFPSHRNSSCHHVMSVFSILNDLWFVNSCWETVWSKWLWINGFIYKDFNTLLLNPNQHFLLCGFFFSSLSSWNAASSLCALKDKLHSFDHHILRISFVLHRSLFLQRFLIPDVSINRSEATSGIISPVWKRNWLCHFEAV